MSDTLTIPELVKQKCTEYSEWIHIEGYFWNWHEKGWSKGMPAVQDVKKATFYTDEQLYEKFKNKP